MLYRICALAEMRSEESPGTLVRRVANRMRSNTILKHLITNVRIKTG